MVNRKQLEGEPGYGREFTLAELETFIADAKAQGFKPDVKPRVRVNFSGGIKVIALDEKYVVAPNPTDAEKQDLHEWFTTW